MTDALDPPLDKARHLRYLKMCYSGPLPHHYLSNETNRMALAYFILTAIELVTPPPPTPDASATETADEPIPESLLRAIDRPRFRRWILALQHPAGGFCGTPSTALPTWSRDDPERDVQQTAHETVGHANLASTTFALLLLAALADDKAAQSAYSGIRRTRILGWLRKLQREDGSFGESLTELPVNGLFIGGGYDMRHCYLAALARWILRGDVKEGDAGWVEDIDVDGLVKYISNSQVWRRRSPSWATLVSCQKTDEKVDL